MSLRTSANRYAKALFDVALEENADLAKVDQDLQAVVAMMDASPQLAQASSFGSTTDAARQSLMEAVSKAMTLTTPVTKTLVLLAKSGKLSLVPDLAAAYRERLLAHQNIVRAEVTSATPLSPEKTQALADSLAKVTGKKVEISAQVDPELLGGVVARIGSTVYDGSVKTQLTRMRQELVKQ
ncbi:MAG TPA: ATP synthase F1 subunit delta [Vicinamibacterales bacterium]|nr:ATP synthase F1 subunit delta [Vicinamibacterales bacterium]